MLAEVGLIGFPNVGKSSILSRISAAKPKIANYHFTTLSPNLGVVSAGEGKGFLAADIPGLIEGASEGLGLGHDFLRHVDRCRLLVHVVDVAGSEGRDPIEDILMINDELRHYSDDLADRPQIIAANKCDILDPETEEETKARLEAFAAENGYEVIYISAASGDNVKPLCRRVYEMLQELPPLTIYEPEYEEVVEEPQSPDDITVTKQGDVWYVEGEWLKWLMSGINFDDRESFMYFEKMIRDKGILQKMRDAGISDGDEVVLYDLEFDFVD
jgi:GTP-binding protein